jgi:hypothetical protein
MFRRKKKKGRSSAWKIYFPGVVAVAPASGGKGQPSAVRPSGFYELAMNLWFIRSITPKNFSIFLSLKNASNCTCCALAGRCQGGAQRAGDHSTNGMDVMARVSLRDRLHDVPGPLHQRAALQRSGWWCCICMSPSPSSELRPRTILVPPHSRLVCIVSSVVLACSRTHASLCISLSVALVW